MRPRWIAAPRTASRGAGRASLGAMLLPVALLAAIAAGCGKSEESAAPAGGGKPAAGAPETPGDALSPREITERVCGLVADQLRRDPKEVTPGATLESLAAEDLDRNEILMSCEAEFEIHLPDEAADAWRTVGDVIADVTRALDERKD